jgi:hypothetical protein
MDTSLTSSVANLIVKPPLLDDGKGGVIATGKIKNSSAFGTTVSLRNICAYRRNGSTYRSITFALATLKNYPASRCEVREGG